MKSTHLALCLAAFVGSLSTTGIARADDDIELEDEGPRTTPTVATVAAFTHGLRFGTSRADLIRIVSAPGGLVDKEFNPRLREAAPGIQQQSIENERDMVKRSFLRSAIEFKLNSPSGLDAGPLGKEYTYGNRESAMLLQVGARKRYFFFFGDKLWKVYDELELDSPEAQGKTFAEVESKLSTKFGNVAPHRGFDASGYAQIDWQDNVTRLRVVDRSREKKVAFVVEERNTLNNLASLRTAQSTDPFAIDPSIVALTKGGLSDPNQQRAPEEAPEEPKPKKKRSNKK